MSRVSQDTLARLAYFVMLDEDQLLDEMLAHPEGSERYRCALAELRRRALDINEEEET